MVLQWFRDDGLQEMPGELYYIIFSLFFELAGHGPN